MRNRILTYLPAALLCATLASLLIAPSGTALAACQENPGGTCRNHNTCSPPANGRCKDVLVPREGYKCECTAPSRRLPKKKLDT